MLMKHPVSSPILHNRITISPDICHGKPVIRGLRYPVENVLEWLGGGMSIDEILSDYEDLERDDIYAALSFAAHWMHVKRIELVQA
jgi:uncharacterized protein (DUF433 family)